MGLNELLFRKPECYIMRLIEDCLVNGMERTNGRLDEWMNGEKSQVLNI